MSEPRRVRRSIPNLEPVTELLRALEEVPSDTGERRRPFTTGMELLDAVLEGGLKLHDLVLVGGLPGVGKTITALQWARNAAVSGRPVVFACYEHDVSELLARLLLMEIGELPRATDAADSSRVRRAIRHFAVGRRNLEELLGEGLLIRAAYERVASYAEHLSLVQTSPTSTGLLEIEEMAAAQAEPALIFVDYLQKVAAPNLDWTEDRRISHSVEGLKDIALRYPVTVVAITAASETGLTSRRLRTEHLRGSAALAFEADAIVILNHKMDIVSRVHLTYGPSKAAAFQQQVIFTIEKNRGGAAGIDLEFTKDFGHYRFDPIGRHVEESLVDDVLIRD